eukprot:Sspe_Gene.118565::Locus_112265_Transcript_1_1_Confidence_1.000_Length_442::g.118565::m.118565
MNDDLAKRFSWHSVEDTSGNWVTTDIERRLRRLREGILAQYHDAQLRAIKRNSVGLVLPSSEFFIFLCIFFLVAFVFGIFLREYVEEQEILKDFENHTETLHTVAEYCKRLSIWNLEELPLAGTGQIELYLRQAMSSLRVLQPFVPH